MNIRLILLSTLLGVFLVISSCSDDDRVVPPLTGNEMSYALFEVNGSGVEGTAWFREREDGAVLVELVVTGTLPGDIHPANIYLGNTTMDGAIAFSLNPIDGATGESETVITETNAGDPIAYEELLEYDGYINVHQSEAELDVIIAQGDIGQNTLTGEAEFYKLYNPDPEDNTELATVAFKERENGNTLVEIQYTGSTDVDHPNHIYIGTAATGGPIAITLDTIKSEWTRTNVSQLNDGTAITYDELINYNGFINVHHSAGDLGTILAQGDIGANEFTGNESPEYDLEQVNSSGIVGKARFYERKDNTTLAIITLGGTTNDAAHPTNIHDNSVSETGPIAISLGNLSNDNNFIEIDEKDDGTPITFQELLQYDGHINVNLNDSELSVYVAQGNIGSNVE